MMSRKDVEQMFDQELDCFRGGWWEEDLISAFTSKKEGLVKMALKWFATHPDARRATLAFLIANSEVELVGWSFIDVSGNTKDVLRKLAELG